MIKTCLCAEGLHATEALMQKV